METLGPFSANQNDAKIMKEILEDSNGLTSLLKAGDICVVDRGFRDAQETLTVCGNVIIITCKKEIIKKIIIVLTYFCLKCCC